VTELPSEADDADNDGGSSTKQKRGFVTKYVVALALFLVAIALSLGSYLIFPTDSPVTVHDGIQGISTTSVFTPTAVDIHEASLGATGVRLTIRVRAASNQIPPTGDVVVVVPPQAWGSPLRCPAPAAYCTIDKAGFKNAHYRLDPSPSPTNPQHDWVDMGLDRAQYRYLREVHITIADVGRNFARNHEYIATLLPPVIAQNQAASCVNLQPAQCAPTAQDVPVNYDETVAEGRNYTWNAGSTIPVYVGGAFHWIYGTSLTLATSVSPTFYSGVDLEVQDQNSTLTFLAGALLGIAGGALVGAIQEGVHARKEELAARKQQQQAA